MNVFLTKMHSRKYQAAAFVLAAVCVCVGINIAVAQQRSYSYNLFNQEIRVNKDSTIDVAEHEVFNFVGGYHKGYRSISKQKIGNISDVRVVDGATNVPLTLSSVQLDKENPSSWEKYYVSDAVDSTNIEWYYDQKDTKHEWIISYKVHGAISFYKNFDELYWNLFTNLEAPVMEASAIVTLPETVDVSKLQSHAYATNPSYIVEPKILSGSQFMFTFKNVAIGDDVTIAAGWPKGVIPWSSYLMDFIRSYGIILLSILAVIGTLIWRILFWYYKEKKPESLRTVVVEYAPPGNIRPAMAEMILHEKVTPKAWSATVVDLAVRGYVKVEEEALSTGEKIIKSAGWIILPIALVPMVILFTLVDSEGIAILVIPAVILGTFMTLYFMRALFSGKLNLTFTTTSYKILRTDKPIDAVFIEAYEQEFLDLFFPDGEKEFSFSKIKTVSASKKQALFLGMQQLEKNLASETETDTKGYEVSIGAFAKNKKTILFGVIAGVILIGRVVLPFLGITAAVFLAAVIIIASLVVDSRTNPRLNQEGRELKRKILGFKLYLETAERYRMQNLTPETFEKYLPYAMLFGVEKKWASAFSGMTIPPPRWYGGTYGNGISSGTSGGFSAGAFASGFSSSFASSFASSGGSGASGGGGGAGGGGGGGGGGAS